MSGPYRDTFEVYEERDKLKRVQLNIEIDEVRGVVRSLLGKLTPEQRVAVLGEWFAGYCRHCGIPLRGGGCPCERDE